MRTAILGCAALVSASLLAGCGPSEPERVLAQPPAPVQTGAPLPPDHVDQPVDLTKFDTDPCSLLTTEQVAAVVADPPDGVRPVRQTTAPTYGCSWVEPFGANATASKPANGPRTLTELSATEARKHDELEPWTETSIDGLPAIVYHQRGSTDDCSVAVQVTDQQMLTFEIVGKDLPGNYWANDRCGGVAKMAEAVIGNLRKP
ncbi:Protein of unknown function [Amycolatopsis australiensis]|uniref:DUF3558 domain-containing protein n=2 Tax=Amycolatopsis australiensis TaxID=546364 RepID=A0A1K1T673_9PSEU|nr:Protein of unknown function [Amycolatopsis australiensis]